MRSPGADIRIEDWAKVAVLGGFLSLFAYFFSVVVKPFPRGLGTLLFFAIGPLSILSVTGFYYVLRSRSPSIALSIGTLFNIIAGVLVNVMAVVQTTQFSTIGRQIRDAPDQTGKEVLTHVLWGVNVVQAGLDISWDIFISLGTIFLGFAVAGHPWYGRVWGGAGMVVASLALVFNLYTFPTAPADSGLIDLGPAVGLWYVIVLIWLLRSWRSIREAQTEPERAVI